MSLISSNGGKTCQPDRSLKEKILNEEIQSLRDVHQQSFETFDKVVLTLKKIINYKNEHIDQELNEVDIKNSFLENLSSMEESLLSLIQDLESDQELYKCTEVFRASEKNIENEVFRKTMKTYESFKDNLNHQINRLEKDIQLLENNGFHIYTFSPKSHNVLSSLKKNHLEKYLQSAALLQQITELLKKKLRETSSDKKQQFFFPQRPKQQPNSQIINNIFWKQQSKQMVLMNEIEKCRKAYQKEVQKIKITETAIKKSNACMEQLKIEVNLHLNNEELSKQDIHSYAETIKQKIALNYHFTPHLFKNIKGRSKSCHTVITRTTAHRTQERMSQRAKEDYSNILGADFLQESMQI